MINQKVYSQVFEKTWKKYFKKGYFGIRNFLKSQLKLSNYHNKKVSISEIKQYIRKEKEKSRKFQLNRLEKYVKEGKKYPNREKFTNLINKRYIRAIERV